jgi:hypothetical protein
MQLENLTGSVNLSWGIISPLMIKIVLGLLLIFIGVLIARGLGSIATSLLKIIKFDKGAKQLGLDQILEKGDVKRTLSELIGDLIYWLLVFVSIFAIADIFGLPADATLAKLFSYIAIVFTAALIIGVGLFLASLVSGIVRVIMVNIGLEGAKTASRIIYYIVIVVAFMGALEALGISSSVFVPQIGVIIGAFGLAAAIAFGLGCKDMAADFLFNLFKGK